MDRPLRSKDMATLVIVLIVLAIFGIEVAIGIVINADVLRAEKEDLP
jgi:hypothetical protein